MMGAAVGTGNLPLKQYVPLQMAACVGIRKKNKSVTRSI